MLPRTLLRAQTAMRVFERVLSLDHAAALLTGDREIAETPPAAALAAVARRRRRPLVPVLEELASSPRASSRRG